jgi:hypothetical protein
MPRSSSNYYAVQSLGIARLYGVLYSKVTGDFREITRHPDIA